MKTLKFLVALIVFGFFRTISAEATVIYSNDFQSGIDSGWSTSSLLTDRQGETVVGLSAEYFYLNSINSGWYDFADDTVTLTLSNIGAGEYEMQFDFYTIYSWDGTGTYGTDKFSVKVNDETRIDAAFGGGWNPPNQTYSDETPMGGGPFPVYTDNTGRDLLDLGYSDTQNWLVHNARYSPVIRFFHTGGDMTFDFIGDVSQPNTWTTDGIPDETWALDNVVVSTVESATIPEPTTILLFGTGLIGLASIRRKTKR